MTEVDRIPQSGVKALAAERRYAEEGLKTADV
jgi:hypothetical protein